MAPSTDSRLRAYYGDCYREGPSAWRQAGAGPKAKNILDFCGGVPHETVVEIGAGDGAVLKELQRRDFARECAAVEISDQAVQVIRDQGIPGVAQVVPYDGAALPFRDGAFDLAILSHVVEHLEHPRQVLYEAGRVARHVFVEVPLEDTFRRRGDYGPDVTGHINFYSPRTIRWLLQTCGFGILEEGVRNPPRVADDRSAGWRGALDHVLTKGLLALVPPLAPYLTWKYVCALLAKSPRTPGVVIGR